jgi:OmpA-OmpF porin, OOP family
MNEVGGNGGGSEVSNTNTPKDSTKKLIHSGIDWWNAKRKPNILAQLNGMTTFMLGDAIWRALPEGYAHTLGFGGTVFLDYTLNPTFFAGIETGYLKWSTRIDFVESRKGPVIDQYYAEVSQIPLLAHVRVNLGKHFYLMPEGGLHLLKVKAGFGQPTDSYSGTQLAYGGTLGYVHYLELNKKIKIRVDIGAFYRQTTNSKTWALQYGAAPMQYVGLRAGIGSLF